MAYRSIIALLLALAPGGFAAPGEVDLDFPNLQIAGSDRVHAAAVQPDGKIIIAGDFSSVLGVARPKIARLTRDGTLDLGFTPASFPQVNCVAVQADGKVIVGGIAGARPIVRLNANGSLDTSFFLIANGNVDCLAVQADGRILLGGTFTTIQAAGATSATARRYIARLHADGTLDAGFDPKPNSGGVSSLAIQDDGKILVAGRFTTLQPNGAAVATTRRYIARVEADGMLDTGFDPNASSFVTGVAVQGDGKIVLSGEFTWLWPNGAAASTARRGLARVHADGTLDDGFDPQPDSSVSGTAIQADGKILLGGSFGTFQPNGAPAPIPRSRGARLHPDGTLDLDFAPNPTGHLNGAALQSDGKALLIGFFFALQPPGTASPISRFKVARLSNDPASQALSLPDATRVRWLLGGSSPETTQVTFDLSTDGGVTFNPLGAGTRIAGGWERTGLTLPASGEIRARARTHGGWRNGSSGLVEAILPFGGVAPEIVVEQPTGTGIADGGGVDFGKAILGDPGLTRIFTIKNIGTASLTDLIITKDGLDADMFTVTTGPTGLLAGGDSTTFTVRFAPTSAGPKTATFRIASSDADESPFDITVVGVSEFSTNANLAGLSLSSGSLVPSFSSGTTSYAVSVPYGVNSVSVTAALAQSTATVTVNGDAVPSGSASGLIALNVGANSIATVVTAGDGVTKKAYNLAVTRDAPGPGDVQALDASIFGDEVRATAVQPDGKMIIAGEFTSVLGVPRLNIARLNADGTLDAGFDPRVGGSYINVVAVQADGKVLLGGSFHALLPNGAATGTSRNNIARVNADGTLDEGFDPKTDNTVFSLALQADGKVLIGGAFINLQPNGAATTTRRQFMARLHADGTVDQDFDPAPSGRVQSMAVRADGKILLGGEFTSLQPAGATSLTARQYVARLNGDGTVDATFDPTANDEVYCVAEQADGKILLGGRFTTLKPNGAITAMARSYIARVHANGTLDTSFDPKANFFVQSLALQADGKVLLAGGFSTLQPNGAQVATARERVARVHADGTLDTGFDPKASGSVYAVANQADGMVLLGGVFGTLQPNGALTTTVRNRFARLLNDPAAQSFSAPDATKVLWTRGGAGPELSRVTFELSTNDGANWGLLGAGARVGTTANWQLTGLALPASGLLRARGTTTGGYYNGSSGLIEQIVAFATTPYGQWKLSQLGNANAPDDGNLDADAFDNLEEYGLVQSPTAFSAGPVGELFSYPEGDRLRIVFTRDPARNDVTIEVLATDDLSGPWTPIASSVLGGVTTGAGYYGGDSAGPGLKTVEVRDLYKVDDPAHPRRFLRLRVSR